MPAFALLCFPILTIVLFASIGPARGLIWSVLAGYLFLPQGYQLELFVLPPVGKTDTIAISVVLGYLLFREKEPSPPVQDPLLKVLLIGLAGLIMIGHFGTWVTNTEVLVNGSAVRPALTLKDALKAVFDSMVNLTPFFLGWRLLFRPEDRMHLLVAVTCVGVFYTVLVLFELRMSPQLHNMVYGYFPHSWNQHLRGGGYRPLVFLKHGLWLGFFLLIVAFSAFALVRQDASRRVVWLFAGAWVLLVLSLSRNLGATSLALLFLPVLFLTTQRMQARVAAVICCFFLVYPILAEVKLTPDRIVTSITERISPVRARSFAVRLDNEELHLERAALKPVFGWGPWARSRIFTETGRDISITDSMWVGILTIHGWAGYIGFFGLLSMPVVFLGRAYRRKRSGEAVVTGMALILAANLLYLIPNSALSPVAYLMAGAVAAFALKDAVGSDEPEKETSMEREARYSRFKGPTSARQNRPQSQLRRFPMQQKTSD